MKFQNYCPKTIMFLIAMASISLSPFVRAQEAEKKGRNLLTQSTASLKAGSSGEKKKSQHRKSGHKAHVHGHGVAQLTLAYDSLLEMTLLLEAPGQEIIGFEHEPKNPTEEKKQSEALALLEDKAAEFFVFEPQLSCLIRKKNLDLRRESCSSHGQHAEVEVEYAVLCQKPFPGTTMELKLGETFQKLKRVDVKILGPQSQQLLKVKKGRGSVKL